MAVAKKNETYTGSRDADVPEMRMQEGDGGHAWVESNSAEAETDPMENAQAMDTFSMDDFMSDADSGEMGIRWQDMDRMEDGTIKGVVVHVPDKSKLEVKSRTSAKNLPYDYTVVPRALWFVFKKTATGQVYPVVTRKESGVEMPLAHCTTSLFFKWDTMAKRKVWIEPKMPDSAEYVWMFDHRRDSRPRPDQPDAYVNKIAFKFEGKGGLCEKMFNYPIQY